MRKLTVVMVCALASMAKAELPKLNMSGYFVANTYAVKQKVRTEKEVTFASRGELMATASGTSENGLQYGGLAVLKFDRDKSSSSRIDESYIFLNSSEFGSIQVGDSDGIWNMMMYGSKDVLGGLGGWSGDMWQITNAPRGVNYQVGAPTFYDKSTKINYLSPVVKGFQAGFTYVPSTKLYGRNMRVFTLKSDGSRSFLREGPVVQNLVSAGLAYNRSFGSVGVGLFLTGTHGSAKASQKNVLGGSKDTLHDVRTLHFGTLLDYGNWQAGLELFDNGRSLMPKRDPRVAGANPSRISWTNTSGYTAAIGYGFGPTSVALGYASTSRKVTGGKASSNITSLTVDYAVAPGLVVYGEADHFSYKSSKAHREADFGNNYGNLIYDRSNNPNNNGALVLVGTKFRF